MHIFLYFLLCVLCIIIEIIGFYVAIKFIAFLSNIIDKLFSKILIAHNKEVMEHMEWY